MFNDVNEAENEWQIFFLFWVGLGLVNYNQNMKVGLVSFLNL